MMNEKYHASENSVEHTSPDINDETNELIASLPKEKQGKATQFFAHYQGPVMPPAMLAEIERIIPGGADRVLCLTEKEQNHRHNIDTIQTSTLAWQTKASLIGGLVAFLALIAGIIFCAASGYVWGAGSLAVISAFGVISHIIKLPARTSKK